MDFPKNSIISCNTIQLAPQNSGDALSYLQSGKCLHYTRVQKLLVCPFREMSVCVFHNILEPLLKLPYKKESKTTMDSKNLVEPLEPR